MFSSPNYIPCFAYEIAKPSPDITIKVAAFTVSEKSISINLCTHTNLRHQCFFSTDRHSHDSVEVQKEEEMKFKEVGEAYAVLSDQKKRMRYDNGHDLEDLDGGGFGKKYWSL